MRLQAEIRELEKQLGVNQLIQLRLRIVEVESSALAELGLAGEPDRETPACPRDVVIENTAATEFIESLRSLKSAKVITDSSMVMKSGHPGSVVSGSEVALPAPGDAADAEVQPQFIGIWVDVLPRTCNGERVSLEVSAKYTFRDGSTNLQADSIELPGLTTKAIQAEQDIRFGQTLVALMSSSGFGSKEVGDAADHADGCGSRRVTLLMVTPQLITPIAVE